MGGVSATDWTPATVNVNGAEVGTPATVAVIFVVFVGSGKAVAEKSTPVARPVALLMVATLGLLEANVAATTPVVPSLYFAVAVN
ncbi:MAG TPA: hypothetical protein VEI01_17135 [Terriglobales bacterium]|nr:hypothetical protein [Terriglobales bacterium]